MKVCMILAEGFEEAEAVIPADLLRRGGVEVILAGIKGMTVVSSHKITMQADALLENISLADVDMVFVPGGLGGVSGILADEKACDFLRSAVKMDKYLAAICAGPTVLSRLGMIDGKKAVCYPGMENLLNPADPQPGCRVVQDGRLLTGEACGSAFDLGLRMLAVLTDEANAGKVRDSVHYHG